MHSLPIFVRLAGRPVMLIGAGEAAQAKRRLLERAGAEVVGEEQEAALAIVAQDDPEPIVSRLRARGVLVNAVDRPDLCDFTLPAIVDRDPVLVAIGTGGASAGLAKALRQRLEMMLPASLGALAEAIYRARARVRTRWPAADERRRAIDAALDPGGPLDPMSERAPAAVDRWLDFPDEGAGSAVHRIRLNSPDPDDLTLRQARLLGQADRIYVGAGVPETILNRARADAERLPGRAPAEPGPGVVLDIDIEFA